MPFRPRNANAQPLARNASAADVKRRALELGADLAGIASAATLNAFPPDPRWPQTPERILPSLKSVIVLVQRIPAGAFRAVSNVPVQYMDMLVLRKMDKVAYRLADELERAGHPTFVSAAQETDWSLKRASYGRLSTRHLGVEAGLGTLGLEVNILTPEFGPRVYLTGILTELELEPDQRITEQVCIGESCSRCLHSCPPNAVLHWGIDKRGCATEAQEFGFMTMLQFMERVIDAPADQRSAMLKTRDLVGFADGARLDTAHITQLDAGRAIVLAKRLNDGVARIRRWDDRHKYYNDELALTHLEETSLELVYWLEDAGYPAIIVPPTHVDPAQYQDRPDEHLTPMLSLPHAAVEAGLGTLGLNLQLLTPEYGPRVVLTAVLCSVDVECDP